MASTNFTDATASVPGTPVVSAWLNEVNTATHALLTGVAGNNTITAVGPPSMTGYATGQRFFFNPAANNTGNVTININGLGARAITKLGNILLVTQDLLGGTMAEIVYDGAGFQLLNPQSVNLTQIIPVTNGGTGATTAAAARTNLGAAASGANSDITSLSGLTTPLSVLQGGTGNVGGGWSSSVCTIAASSGSLSNASANIVYQKIGRCVNFIITSTVILNGTGANNIDVTTPFIAANEHAWGGRETNSTGLAITGTMAAGSAIVRIFKYDNTYPAGNNTRMVIAGVMNTTT